MRSLIPLFNQFDSIVASIPIRDNRPYYDKWRHTTTFDMNLAVQEAKKNMRNIAEWIYRKENSNNLEAGKEKMIEYVRIIIDKLSNIDIQNITGKDSVYVTDVPNEDLEFLHDCERFAKNDTRRYPGKNYFEIVNTIKHGDKYNSFSDADIKKSLNLELSITKDSLIAYFEEWIKCIKSISTTIGHDSISLILSLLEEYRRLQREDYDKSIQTILQKITDDDIIAYVEDHPAAKKAPAFQRKTKDASKLYDLYKSWFASMGAKYRIVPPEMQIKSEISLINKFNAALMSIIYEYMIAAHKEAEVEAISNWSKSHPIEHPYKGIVKIKNNERDLETIGRFYFDVFHGSHGSIEWPKTPENYYKTKYYTYMSDPRRKERIGKYLTWGLKNSLNADMAYSLNKIFNEHSMSDSGDNELCVVISWHEYDIVGQSTDREWTSCQNIYTGEYRDFVESGMLAGSLIAYLCDVGDTEVKVKQNGPEKHETIRDSANDKYVRGKKINIQRPLGRVLIKPFIHYDEEQNYADPNWILRVSKKYGTFPDDLLMKLQGWLDINWNSNIINKYDNTKNKRTGRAFEAPNSVYKDTNEEHSMFWAD